MLSDWGLKRFFRVALDSPVAVDAQFGAMGQDPQLTLGGTEIIPLADSEDAHVLETAIAGQAHILVTANSRDFRFKDIEVIEPERHGRYQRVGQVITLVHPYRMLEWIRSETLPLLVRSKLT